MTAAELMTTPVVSVRPDTPLDDAAQLLVEHKIATMPVIDDAGRLAGLVTESDVFRALAIRLGIGLSPTAEFDPSQASNTVIGVTHRRPASVRSGDSDRMCVLKMLRHDGRSLVVREHGKVVGIISRRDVIGALARQTRVGEQLDAATVHVARSIDLRLSRDLDPTSTEMATP